MVRHQPAVQRCLVKRVEAPRKHSIFRKKSWTSALMLSNSSEQTRFQNREPPCNSNKSYLTRAPKKTLLLWLMDPISKCLTTLSSIRAEQQEGLVRQGSCLGMVS